MVIHICVNKAIDLFYKIYFILSDEMLVELKSLSIHENLTSDIGQRFRDNIEISNACAFVKQKIEDLIKVELEEQQAEISKVKSKFLWKKLHENPANF